MDSGSPNSIREIRLGSLGESEERLKENIHVDGGIHLHCSFINVYCFLSPYKLAEPLSYCARRAPHQRRLKACADRDKICGSAFGVLEIQSSLSHRNNVITPSSLSR